MAVLLDVVLPVFGVIFAGYVAGHIRLLGDAGSEALNRFVFYAALPALLFLSMARMQPARIFDWAYIASYGGGALITFALALLMVRYGARQRPAAASIVAMGAVFGNTAYIGIPLAQIAYGEDGALLAAIATVFNSSVLIALVTAIAEADLRNGNGASSRREFAFAGLGNPLLIASSLGIAISLSGYTLPASLATASGLLGSAAGPCALFALGLFLVGQPLGDAAAGTTISVVLKLGVHPSVTWLIATRIFHLGGAHAAMAVIMAALPAGANVFVLAQRYGIAVPAASATIVVSTGLSVFTLTALLAAYAL